MSDIAKIIGQRVRNYRNQCGLSQERLAETAGLHPTYIGQIERGEKNVTIESISKISEALNLPLSKLFEKLDSRISEDVSINIPLQCYEFLATKSVAEQEQLFRILLEIDKYKDL